MEVENICSGYFMSLFFSLGLCADNIKRVTRLVKKRVSNREQVVLDRPFTPLEDREALFQIHPNKSPGPDGLSPLFYYSQWESVDGTITDLCLKVLNEATDASCINRMLITLMPKVDNPSCVTLF